jgi:hypothetical protein
MRLKARVTRQAAITSPEFEPRGGVSGKPRKAHRKRKGRILAAIVRPPARHCCCPWYFLYRPAFPGVIPFWEFQESFCVFCVLCGPENLPTLLKPGFARSLVRGWLRPKNRRVAGARLTGKRQCLGTRPCRAGSGAEPGGGAAQSRSGTVGGAPGLCPAEVLNSSSGRVSN